MTVCLITRPEHDDTTFYLSNYSKEVIESAQKRGIKVLDLHREKAKRSEVESRLSKSLCNLVFFNGHGDYSCVTGHKNEPLIICNENETLLKSKIVYTISCKSAKELGPKSVEAGAISYSGYDDDFIFSYEPDKISRPLQDETAKLFLEPSKLFMTSLVKGNSVIESQKRTKTLFRENILRLLDSDNPDNDLLRYLVWDSRHLISHGNLNASI